MKVIIAGSRDITNYDVLLEAIAESGFEITEVVCGGARGADALGETWARKHSLPIRYFYADWNKLGKRAGYVRNADMAKYGEALIALWDGSSKGTGHMIDLANSAGIHVYIHRVNTLNQLLKTTKGS